MRPPRGEDHVRDAGTGLVRAGVWRATALRQPELAVGDHAVEPLVAGLAADAVVGTQLAHGEEPLPLLGEEGSALVQWGTRGPWHRPPPWPP